MTAIALDKETSNYWEIIKDASNKAKLTLMTLISASMVEIERGTVPLIIPLVPSCSTHPWPLR